MEFKVEVVAPLVRMEVQVTGGPAWPGFSDEPSFKVTMVKLMYSLDADGNWDTEDRYDVVLYGTDENGLGWYTSILTEGQFGDMDNQVPWLFKLIEHYKPQGDVDTAATGTGQNWETS